MNAEFISGLLKQSPFKPFKIVKKDGRKLPVKFRHAIWPQSGSMVVFKGIESEKSRYAKGGYEHVSYESVERIDLPKERRPRKKGPNGKH